MTRTLGVLASTRHARARGATIRRELIAVAARPARSGRDTITWHLPEAWPWQDAWHGLFEATSRIGIRAGVRPAHRGPPTLAV